MKDSDHFLSLFTVLKKSSDFPTDLEDADLYTIDVVWSEIQFAVSQNYCIKYCNIIT